MAGLAHMNINLICLDLSNNKCVNWMLHLQSWLKKFNNLSVLPFLCPIYCSPKKGLQSHINLTSKQPRRVGRWSIKIILKTFSSWTCHNYCNNMYWPWYRYITGTLVRVVASHYCDPTYHHKQIKFVLSTLNPPTYCK